MTLLAALYAYGLVGLCVSVTCARKVQGVFDVLVITALWPVVVGAWVRNAFRSRK